MSVGSLAILLVNVVCVVAQEGVVVAAPLDIVEVLVMVAGAIVLVGGHQDVAVCHLVDAAIAGRHHFVDERRCHMPMVTV